MADPNVCLKFSQTQKTLTNGDFSSMLPIYTLKSVSDFIECSFLLQSMLKKCADKCLKMKFLIDICTVFKGVATIGSSRHVHTHNFHKNSIVDAYGRCF